MFEKIVEKIKSEPVRVRLYTIIAAVVTYAVVRGYVTPTDAEFIVTMAALVLAVETSRRKVTPER